MIYADCGAITINPDFQLNNPGKTRSPDIEYYEVTICCKRRLISGYHFLQEDQFEACYRESRSQ